MLVDHVNLRLQSVQVFHTASDFGEDSFFSLQNVAELLSLIRALRLFHIERFRRVVRRTCLLLLGVRTEEQPIVDVEDLHGVALRLIFQPALEKEN